MYTVLKIGESDVELLANAATPYRVKQIFGLDIMRIFFNADKDGGIDTANLIPQLAYVMNAQALKQDMTKLNEDTFYVWCEQFSAFDLISNSDKIIDVYLGNQQSDSESKKK